MPSVRPGRSGSRADRSLETTTHNAFCGSLPELSAHSSSMIRSEDTARFALIKSRASSARCFSTPRSIGSPLRSAWICPSTLKLSRVGSGMTSSLG